jgi:uroporphyrinogen-III synthase
MKSKVVAILETRTGSHLAELIARRGGVPWSAPALAEVPDIEPQAVAALLQRWREHPFEVAVFQTGVGTRALFGAADRVGLTDELVQRLGRACVVVRGPKPVGELNARDVRIDIRAPSPFTTATVLSAIAMPLNGCHVLVQRYGAENLELRRGLEARGAAVQEIATYRWALPADTGPLVELLDGLSNARVDAVLFTSAVQMHNLYAVAEKTGHAPRLAGYLNRVLIASIGPVCSRALQQYGVTPTLEADPPKLGPFVAAVDAALS